MWALGTCVSYHSETGTAQAQLLMCLLLPGAHHPPSPHKGSQRLHYFLGTVPSPLNCLLSLIGPINSHWCTFQPGALSWHTDPRWSTKSSRALCQVLCRSSTPLCLLAKPVIGRESLGTPEEGVFLEISQWKILFQYLRVYFLNPHIDRAIYWAFHYIWETGDTCRKEIWNIDKWKIRGSWFIN